MSTALNHQKNFWIEAIEALRQYKGVAWNILEANDNSEDGDVLANKFSDLGTWNEIETFAVEVCKEIYQKATVNNAGNEANYPVNDDGEDNFWGLANKLRDIKEGDDYEDMAVRVIGEFEDETQDLSQFFQNKLGVGYDNAAFVPDPENEGQFLKDEAGNDIPIWKYFINSKIPTDITLNDIPLGMNLLRLIYRNELYKQIVGSLPDLVERGEVLPDGTYARVWNSHGYNFNYGVDTDKLQEYKGSKNLIQEIADSIKDLLGVATIDDIPNDWNTKLVKKSDLDTANATITTLTTERDNYKTKADDYDRIHTKLSGKVSDSELDDILNKVPSCSHTDYDTIKTERDNLKTENTNLKNGSQNKEKEILEKLITDCNLGLAKNSSLEQVISKIKGMSPTSPTDNSAKITELEQQKSQLETQLVEKEKQITELQTQKPTAEVKEKVIESSKQLGLFSKEFAQKLSKVSNYQELAQVQQEVFEEKLTTEVDEKDSAERLNVVLGTLSIGSLLIIFWMLMKNTKLIKGEKEGN